MKPVSLVLAIVLSVIYGDACAQRGDNRGSIWEQNKPSVVRVIVSGKKPNGDPAPTRIGTGVIVSTTGNILTAMHVVGEDREWLIDGGNNLSRTIEVVSLDDDAGSMKSLGPASVSYMQDLDLAMLYLTASNLKYAAPASRRPSQTSNVIAIVWDKGAKTTRPVRADLEPTDRARFGDVLSLQMTVEEGHSGSPVFDNDGHLAAIVTKKIPENRAAAMPVDRIPSTFLPAGSAEQNVKYREIAKREEDGQASLRLEVRKKNNYPVRGVRLRVYGQTARSSNETTDSGQCFLPLPSGSKPAAVMTLEMDQSHPPSSAWYIVSPKRGRMVLPDPANELEFFIEVEIAESVPEASSGEGPRSIDSFRSTNVLPNK